ncbi:MAG TPA: hydrogenase maturation protease [Candidatus Krumholzibacteriaceae bacterium]|nr:hydrogenase maturation protease [Candidatus Krumholzibacteriaceae bacterium]
METRRESENSSGSIIVGVGNTTMLDEGVGVRVVQEMRKSGNYPTGFEIDEVGASSFNIIHLVSSKNIAVLVDCAYMGEDPGVIRMFTPGEAESRKITTGLSLHEGDLIQAVRLMEHTGAMPKWLYFFGIEPVEVAPGDRLSPLLEEKLDEYAGFINEMILSVIRKIEDADA